MLRDFAVSYRYGLIALAAAICAIALTFCSTARGQAIIGGNQAVGGIAIDTDGILSTARQEAVDALSKVRTKTMQGVPAAMNSAVPMRKVSLRRLEATLAQCARDHQPIPDAAKYLAGLQRIHYILVYPEQQDIVLVGPGEGWKVDAKGTVVGVVTGRPVMLLDDLLVAFQTAKAAAHGGILCSIDPTPEGMARLEQVKAALKGSGDAQLVASRWEEALGMQRISVAGVPDTSHFARVLVAADYRMKRLGMNFDPSPVRGLPSYLQMIPASSRGIQTPRFWLEPTYEALLHDADGLAYELRGSGVKAMTEEDFLAANGNLQHSGKAGHIAQKWADLMTEKYPQLAVADPIFGQLQNCMDLAVAGALIVKDRLPEKAGNSFPALFDSPVVAPEAFNAPKQVKSMASVLEKGRHPIVSVSGGVAINSWLIADKARTSDTVGAVRAKAAPAQNASWWWN